MLLEGKTAVITGCNRGIGLSILKKFSEIIVILLPAIKQIIMRSLLLFVMN